MNQKTEINTSLLPVNTSLEAYGIRNQEAKTVAQKLTDKFFFQFGLPEQLHSDQGRSFESDIIKEVCTIQKISNVSLPPAVGWFGQTDLGRYAVYGC